MPAKIKPGLFDEFFAPARQTVAYERSLKSDPTARTPKGWRLCPDCKTLFRLGRGRPPRLCRQCEERRRRDSSAADRRLEKLMAYYRELSRFAEFRAALAGLREKHRSTLERGGSPTPEIQKEIRELWPVAGGPLVRDVWRSLRLSLRSTAAPLLVVGMRSVDPLPEEKPRPLPPWHKDPAKLRLFARRLACWTNGWTWQRIVDEEAAEAGVTARPGDVRSVTKSTAAWAADLGVKVVKRRRGRPRKGK